MVRRPRLAIAAVLVVAAASTAFLFVGRGDPRLRAFVQGRPPCDVVFTSRSEPASFRAAAAIGEYEPGGVGAKGTGQPQWQAREGRLRLLTRSGVVKELTWGRELPGGGTLVDVMSPTVSPDGRTVTFAGRCATRDGGRFRVYAIGTDGDNLRQLTGTVDDSGCVRVPPLRFDAAGAPLDAEARRRVDYDDVDPQLLDSNILVFASSRMPDTGGRGRRATQIWVKAPDVPPTMISANRANDRWPVLDDGRTVTFSVWSKQDEVVSADGTGLTRGDPRGGLTLPTDRWFAAGVMATGESFGQVVKVPEAVWRARPLGEDRWAFMSPAASDAIPFTPGAETPEAGVLRIGSAAAKTLGAAPSCISAGDVLPPTKEPLVRWLNPVDPAGRGLSAATPARLSDGEFVCAAAPTEAGGPPVPGAYGLFRGDANGWSADGSGRQTLVPLFDDPALVDAEPVALPRRRPPGPTEPLRMMSSGEPQAERKLDLAGGPYLGPTGHVECKMLSSPATGTFPGQTPRDGAGPIVPFFPVQSIQKIAFYSAHRDRFDDAKKIIVPGRFEKLLEVAADYKSAPGSFDAYLPVGSPTLLVGLGADGKVASAPVGGAGTGKFYAYAGDHVSGIRPGGYTFCTGCHAGHSGSR